MKIEIEKGIPLPSKTIKGKVYPWHDMEVGDSFLVKDKSVSNMSGVYSYIGKKYGLKFAGRQLGPDVRVWRIA